MGLASGDLQFLGGHADGDIDAEVLTLGAVDERLADLFEGRNLAGCQGEADLVHFDHLAVLDLLSMQVDMFAVAVEWAIPTRSLCLHSDT
jgi:hypothetical protein